MTMTIAVDNDGKVSINGVQVGTVTVDGQGAITVDGLNLTLTNSNLMIGTAPDGLCNVGLFANVADVFFGRLRIRDGSADQNLVATSQVFANAADGGPSAGYNWQIYISSGPGRPGLEIVNQGSGTLLGLSSQGSTGNMLECRNGADAVVKRIDSTGHVV